MSFRLIALTVIVVSLLSGCEPSPRPQVENESYVPTVLITGSSRGMGLEFARQYCVRGWRVIATARNPDEATELQELKGSCDAIVLEALDVTIEMQIQALSEKYQVDAIDVLINNAGIKGPEVRIDDRMSKQDFDAVMAVNTFAPLRITQALLPAVQNSQLKKIVVITSHLGLQESAKNWGGREPGDTLYYSVSKSALNMAMRILSERINDTGVHINLIAPGFVLTDMIRDSRDDTSGAVSAELAVADMIALIDTLPAELTVTDRHGAPLGF